MDLYKINLCRAFVRGIPRFGFMKGFFSSRNSIRLRNPAEFGVVKECFIVGMHAPIRNSTENIFMQNLQSLTGS